MKCHHGTSAVSGHQEMFGNPHQRTKSPKHRRLLEHSGTPAKGLQRSDCVAPCKGTEQRSGIIFSPSSILRPRSIFCYQLPALSHPNIRFGSFLFWNEYLLEQCVVAPHLRRSVGCHVGNVTYMFTLRRRGVGKKKVRARTDRTLQA